MEAKITFHLISDHKKNLKRTVNFDGTDLGLIRAIEKMRSGDKDRENFDFWSIEKIERIEVSS